MTELLKINEDRYERTPIQYSCVGRRSTDDILDLVYIACDDTSIIPFVFECNVTEGWCIQCKTDSEGHPYGDLEGKFVTEKVHYKNLVLWRLKEGEAP